MRWIKLTEVVEAGKATPILLNLDRIKEFYALSDGHTLVNEIGDEHDWIVQESIDEIYRKIEALHAY